MDKEPAKGEGFESIRDVLQDLPLHEAVEISTVSKLGVVADMSLSSSFYTSLRCFWWGSEIINWSTEYGIGPEGE